MDDNRRLRIRDREDSDLLAQFRPAADAGTPKLLGRTEAVGTYPTATNVYYGVRLVTAGGPEVEGTPGTLTDSEAPLVLALHLGGAAPTEGTYVELFHVPDRWIFFHD